MADLLPYGMLASRAAEGGRPNPYLSRASPVAPAGILAHAGGDGDPGSFAAFRPPHGVPVTFGPPHGAGAAPFSFFGAVTAHTGSHVNLWCNGSAVYHYACYPDANNELRSVFQLEEETIPQTIVFCRNPCYEPSSHFCTAPRYEVPATKQGGGAGEVADLSNIWQLNRFLREAESRVQSVDKTSRAYRNACDVIKHWKPLGVVRQWVHPSRSKRYGGAIALTVEGRAIVKNNFGTALHAGTRLFLVIRRERIKGAALGETLSTFRVVPYACTQGEPRPPLKSLISRDCTQGVGVTYPVGHPDFEIGDAIRLGTVLETTRCEPLVCSSPEDLTPLKAGWLPPTTIHLCIA
jgi:hypothetical protein